MALKVTRVDVWAGDIADQPGGLARVLSAVANAGGSLQCVIARRDQSRPGTGDVFITPIRGARAEEAARNVGLTRAADVTTLRVEGADAPGLGARITEALAAAGINLRGVSAAVVGRNFVAYVGLDNAGDADSATAALRGVKTGGGGGGGGRGARRGGGGGGRGTAKRSGSAKRSTTKRAGGTRKSTAKRRRR